MRPLPNKPIPENVKRIVLINPSYYLGKLLIAGDLIHKFQQLCESREISFLLVIDERFKSLFEGIVPESSLLLYPGELISAGNVIQKAKAYIRCVYAIRRFKADIGFNIETDAVSNRLTQVSGAKFKLGCNQDQRHTLYDHVLPIQRTQRPQGKEHRWYRYYEVFVALGMPEPEVNYLKLAPRLLTAGMEADLVKLGVGFDLPIVVLHPSATQDYKKWPLLNYVHLALALIKAGFQPVFIGYGEQDRSANRAIMHALEKLTSPGQVIDLVDRLTLADLASFLVLSAAIVGNDGGPFHLASALGVEGCVIISPGDVDKWRPLSKDSQIMLGSESCDPECSRESCEFERRCLSSIDPRGVMDKISLIINS